MAVLTHSGGPATSMADAVIRAKLELPAFSDSLKEKIQKLIPHTGAAGNPIDLTFQMDPGLLAETLPRLLLGDPGIDGLLMHGLQGSTFYGDLAEFSEGLFHMEVDPVNQMMEAVHKPLGSFAAEYGKPIVMSSFFNRRDNIVRQLQDAHIPLYQTPEQAVGAMAALVRYARYRQGLSEK
jgi:acyl-CoA synthetase (NDP forming)